MHKWLKKTFQQHQNVLEFPESIDLKFGIDNFIKEDQMESSEIKLHSQR